LISRFKKGLKKTFKKTHQKIWNKESECCKFASALESRAKTEVEKRLRDCEKKKKKIFKKFCRNEDEYLPLLPRGKPLERVVEEAERVETKGF
jgi:hypothetical protein